MKQKRPVVWLISLKMTPFSLSDFVQPFGGVYLTLPNFSVWEKASGAISKHKI
jgi:hypothetical protein